MNKAAAVSTFKKLGLTYRESEVLLWIARGQSNAEIGESLCISPRTVKKHLEHVFSKLGVKTRLAAAVRAGAALSTKESIAIYAIASQLSQLDISGSRFHRRHSNAPFNSKQVELR